MKRYIRIKRWTEGLRLSDLSKNAGLSDFAEPFRKETTKLLGKSVNVVKLVDAKLDIENDWITYTFLTERTPKYNDKKQPMKAVDPSDFELKKDNLYTIEINKIAGG